MYPSFFKCTSHMFRLASAFVAANYKNERIVHSMYSSAKFKYPPIFAVIH